MVVGAVLVAGLATGCQPRMGEFEVTNATDDNTGALGRAAPTRRDA